MTTRMAAHMSRNGASSSSRLTLELITVMSLDEARLTLELITVMSLDEA